MIKYKTIVSKSGQIIDKKQKALYNKGYSLFNIQAVCDGLNVIYVSLYRKEQ